MPQTTVTRVKFCPNLNAVAREKSMKIQVPLGRRIAVKTLVIQMLVICMLWAGVPNVDAHNIDVAKAREKA